MIGFSTSQAYEDEESVSDQSEETTSDSDVEMMTAQPSSSKVFPTPKSSDENLHAETPDKRVPLPRTREISNAETTGRPRPWGLQHAIAVSAPEVPQQLPRKDITTTKLGDQRSVSQRHSTITLEEPNQNPQSLQRMEKSENFLPLASSSANKRRRSDQDAAHKNNKTPQDLSRVRRIPCHSRSLPPSSSPPFRKIPFPGNLTETPKGNNSKLEVDSSDDDDRPSLRSSDTANEESPSLVPGLRRSVSLSDPLFNPYHTECISITRVTHKVFETMQTVLSEKKKSDDGYIYTLRMAERPGFVKIGRTRNAIDNRKKQIKRCIIYNLETINDDDFCPVENHTRVEKLIGDELRNYRRSFPCACKQKRHDGDASDGMTSHGEWFEIDEAKAIEVVTRWRKWMSTGPYRDGSLKQREKLRINIYHKDADRMNAMVTEKDNDWRWHVFMRDTPWQLRKLWLYEILFGERYERSTCSPWDSLWKHWKSNVLFGLVFFLLSCFLSVLSDVLFLSFAFAPPPAVLNTLVLGSGAILYAA